MYTSPLLVSNFLQRDLKANEVATLAVIIPAVQSFIDKRLNSTFDSVAATTRYYDGGVRAIDIDPCTNISVVQAINDDGSGSYAYTTGTEYIAEPQNETVKRSIRKRLARFPHGAQRIAVTAQFSEYDSGVPADIRIMATRLAVGILNTGKNISTGGNVIQESLEGHEIRYNITQQSLEGLAVTDPTVCAILAQRADLFLDDYDPQENYGDDSGGLLL